MVKPIAVIAGVGPGTGSAIARKFAASYPVALLARNPANYEPLLKELNTTGNKAVGIPTDVSSPSSIKAMVAKLKEEFGEETTVAAGVYNVPGPFMLKPFLELETRDLDRSYEGSVKGAFNFSQAILPLLLPTTTTTTSSSPTATGTTYPPTLIFTGATASLKAGSQFASFATMKFALRALSQSLAKEFGPRGVHVAHTVIDGIIDTPGTKGWGSGEEGGKLEPGAIAESYWFLHTQPKTAFTWEMDLRPGAEKW